MGAAFSFVCQCLVHQFSGGAVVAEHADLDQPMSAESGICFLEHSGCQAVSTDHDDRVEMVGQCAVNLALGRGKFVFEP
jgi:hypothetical protein